MRELVVVGSMVSILILVAAGCGSANVWTAADTKATKDILAAQRAVVEFCQSDAGCDKGQVEVVETATSCNLGSMMHRHGALDAGIVGCTP